MLDHLIEFRHRLLMVLAIFCFFFIGFFFYAQHLFAFVVSPLLSTLKGANKLIATEITSTLFVPLELAIDASLLCTAPFALLQGWRFIMPGLYQKERYPLKWIMVASLVLFTLGTLFCFYLILPLMFHFFAKSLPQTVIWMPDISHSLHFIRQMLLVFGLCFQVPLLCWAVVYLGWVETSGLRQLRPYVIVAAFTIGMLLTPPDVLSQLMLALPLWFLYECGIFIADLKDRRKLRQLKKFLKLQP